MTLAVRRYSDGIRWYFDAYTTALNLHGTPKYFQDYHGASKYHGSALQWDILINTMVPNDYHIHVYGISKEYYAVNIVDVKKSMAHFFV